MNYELLWNWKEVAMVCFKLISQHLPGGYMENAEKPYLRQFRGWDSFAGHSEFEAVILIVYRDFYQTGNSTCCT
jgi:hypothetical protein